MGDKLFAVTSAPSLVWGEAMDENGLMGDPENWNSSSFDVDGNEYSGVILALSASVSSTTAAPNVNVFEPEF